MFWKREGVIDGDRGGDGSEKVKDQDVDEVHGKSQGVYSKGGVLHVERTVCNFE